MLRIAGLGPIDSAWRGGFVSIGNFDGVHAGHLELLQTLRERAQAAGVPAIAISFDPHPLAILKPALAPAPLVTTLRKSELLAAAGVEKFAVFSTGPWLLDLSAGDFFEQVLRSRLGVRGIVEGANFTFGKDRRGTIASLRDWIREAGIELVIVDPVKVGDLLVSSSHIRGLLGGGDVAAAGKLLTRPHRIGGKVVEGAKRGASLGFPTANLSAIPQLIPADGVYAGQAIVQSPAPATHPAAIHIGPNATFGESERSVEAHLLDFNANLYGSEIELEFYERIRGSIRFENVRELLERIREDVEITRNVCARRSTRG